MQTAVYDSTISVNDKMTSFTGDNKTPQATALNTDAKITTQAKPESPPTQPQSIADAKPKGEDLSTTTAYAVEKGDNLWNIAKEHYGLTNPKDIQQAVTSIAHENNLANQNRLNIGQELKLPNSPTPPSNANALNDRQLESFKSDMTAERLATSEQQQTAATPVEIPAPAAKQDYFAPPVFKI